ncbi:MAG: MFS transporter [Alphaproteobacteria bacterium]|jgi:predicted MFS family arabinose efflux permease|nr:MFS transporter [Alphaproteobacteria bacterium]
MRELWQTKIRIALPAMLAIQSFGTMCSFAGPVVAVQAAADLGVRPTSIGIYVAVLYIVGMIGGLGAGGVMARFGVIRTSQAALLAAVLGVVLAGIFPIWPVAMAGAVLLGIAVGPLNPAGSRILARHAPAQWQPLVFSIKQTGTPMGGMLAGLLLPPLVALYDWRIAIILIAIIPALTLLGLQTIRNDLDDDRDPAHPVGLGGIADTLLVIIMNRPLITLAAAGYFFTFAQLAILSYAVIYLVESKGLEIAMAGGIFAIIHGSAIPARIFWGLVAGRYISTWALLGLIGIMMSGSILAMSLFSPAWPFWLSALVAVLLGASINGVLGLLLSEFARLAPVGKVGEATGGGQFFLFFGIVSGPPVFGAMVEFGGGYGNAFYLLSAVTLAAGIFLLATTRRGRRD